MCLKVCLKGLHTKCLTLCVNLLHTSVYQCVKHPLVFHTLIHTCVHIHIKVVSTMETPNTECLKVCFKVPHNHYQFKHTLKHTVKHTLHIKVVSTMETPHIDLKVFVSLRYCVFKTHFLNTLLNTLCLNCHTFKHTVFTPHFTVLGVSMVETTFMSLYEVLCDTLFVIMCVKCVFKLTYFTHVWIVWGRV